MRPPSQRRFVKIGVLCLVVFVAAWPFLKPGVQAAPPPQSDVTPTQVIHLPLIQSNGSTSTPRTGTITGLVWNDVDGDGNMDATESGLGVPGGIHIALEDPAFNKIAETVTDVSNGTYTFAFVPPGNYYVVERDGVGYQSTTANTVTLFLTANTTVLVYFGDQKTLTPTPTATPSITRTPTPTTGTVAGIVWMDADGDGALDSTETGIPGVIISLKNPAFVDMLVPVSTSSDGHYTFGNVPPGNYYVVETDPPGFSSTTPNTLSISVLANTAYQLSFGDQPVATATPTATATATPTATPTAAISGRVFRDSNLDYVFNGSDVGVVATIELSLSDWSPVSTTTSGANGSFSFGPLAPGNYYVVLTVPSGYETLTASIVSVYLAPSSNVNVAFVLYQPAADGAGTMVVSPTSVTAGSATSLTFTFAAPAGQDFVGGSRATIVVPAGWTAPQTSNPAGAGYVSVVGGSPACNAYSSSVAGSIITVDMECPGATSFILTYANATATTSGPNTFTTSTKNNGGTLTAIASSPVVTVH